MILEEIRMRDDTPDDLVHDVFAGALFPEHPLGREMLGHRGDDRRGHPRPDRRVPRARTTSPSNVVVAVAGNVDHDEVVALRRAPRCRRRRRDPSRRASTAPTPADPSRSRASTVRSSSRTSSSAPRALRRDDPDRFALAVVDQVLGGGMSSRLFQEVREKRGLAYSVFSYRSAFEETGSLAVYCGTAPERVDETLDVVARRARPPGRRRRRLRARARRAPRATSPVRWRCRWRARRAACTASAAPSSRWARSRASTRSSSRSTRSPPTTSRRVIDRVLGDAARARSRWSVPRRESTLADLTASVGRCR